MFKSKILKVLLGVKVSNIEKILIEVLSSRLGDTNKIAIS